MNQANFAKLVHRCQSVTNLPEMPEGVYRLVRELDAEEPNLTAVERLIYSDPAFTAKVLRVAGSALYAPSTAQVTTVRGAMTILGEKALRDMAVATWLQSAFAKVSNESGVSPERFTAHSTFVGFLSKYLYSCAIRRQQLRPDLHPDEVFAIGDLHDLGIGVLAFIEPKLCGTLAMRARFASMSLDALFAKEFGHPIQSLGLEAAKAWGLPLPFCAYQGSKALELGWEFDATAQLCIDMANQIAEMGEHSLTEWPTATEWAAFGEAETGVSEDDLAQVTELIVHHTREFAGIKAA